MKSLLAALLIAVAMSSFSVAQTQDQCFTLPEATEVYKNMPPVSETVDVTTYTDTQYTNILNTLTEKGLAPTEEADTFVVFSAPEAENTVIVTLMKDNCIGLSLPFPTSIWNEIVQISLGEPT